MITRELMKMKKIKPLKTIRVDVIRRYLRIKINIDIEPLGLSKRIERLETNTS